MTPQEAIAYIENCGWSATRLGLERTKELLERLGNPQKRLKFIHVAGSNGKGSTCAMLDAILRASGYRVGLYTSPHIEDFGERMRIDGENISGEALSVYTGRVREAAESMDDHPSQFELVTAIAMLCFADAHCDIVVLEVGMGGALDSTNVIDAPELAIITNIGLEHTEYLGSTPEEIARTKGGIIKPGCDCVCYAGDPAVTGVIQGLCRERRAVLTCADFSRMECPEQDLTGQTLLWQGARYRLRLIGAHQTRNAAVVLTAVEVLRRRGWVIPAEAAARGLATVVWPARLEVLRQKPCFLLDGGHNPQCAEALAESLARLLPGQRVTFLLGVLSDKDYGAVLELVRPFAARFVCVTPLSDRALPAEALQAYITARLHIEAEACATVEEGLARALTLAGETGSVVAFGSLYMAGAVRSHFPAALRTWARRRGIERREALTDAAREEYARRTVARLVRWEAFRRAHTILLYAHTRGELSLDSLLSHPAAAGKRFLWPKCVGKGEMVALCPHGESAWETGYCGIREPSAARSDTVPPEEIDLVVCPCTAFDGEGNRLGMGAGFYDRYLPQCRHAAVCAVAFSCQKTETLPAAPWDVPMQAVFTETESREGSGKEGIA